MSAAHAGARNHNFGKPMSDKSKRLLSEAAHRRKAEGRGGCAGKPKTKDHRLKLSAALKGRMAGAKNPVACIVICLDNGVVFETYASAAAWLRANGKPKADLSTIRKAARGMLKSAYGLKWFAPQIPRGASLEHHIAFELGMNVTYAGQIQRRAA